MNRNPKEKLARIEIRVKPQEKDKIKQLAEKCNLSISEYMAQRALGYEPITVLPDVFFDFYIEPSSPKPLSPALRQEVRKLDQTLKEYKLLCENQIDSAQELVSFIEKKSTDISALESERQKIYNRIRHPKSEDEKEQNKTASRSRGTIKAGTSFIPAFTAARNRLCPDTISYSSAVFSFGRTINGDKIPCS